MEEWITVKLYRQIVEAVERGEWWAILFVVMGVLFVFAILFSIGAMVIFTKH